jgi:hypothetical protein
MTLGFAAAAWTEADDRLVVVAADTRITFDGGRHSDTGVKTFELGGPCALVASGNALPPMMAAELTRSLVENHNRRTPERRVSFFDTVRLASFFLRRAWNDRGPPCRVAAAGFLEDGGPCLASIVVSPGFNRTAFHKIVKGGTTAMPVGDPSGGRLVVEAMAEAKRQKRPTIEAAVGVLVYTARHQGAFQGVGGGLSVGTCMFGAEYFSWPLIEIDGSHFLRGMDVTAAYRPGWPKPEVLRYDESWCAEQDRRVAALPDQPLRRAGTLPGFDIDELKPETLFASHHEPDLSMQLASESDPSAT